MKRNSILLVAAAFLSMIHFSFAWDQEGKGMEVDSLEEITLGGVKQWILMRGESRDNPILLYLHGGPGSTEMPHTHVDSRLLEKHFIVVNWDQRGSGKSYDPEIPRETMTINQYLSDTHELILLLKKRFGKEKIFLLGHSWGSVLGLYTAQKYPKDMYAYIGMGQVVDMRKGEKISYEYVLEKAREAQDVNALAQLEKIGPPENWHGYEPVGIQRQLLARYGGSFQKMTYMDMGRLWYTSPYYTDADRKNLIAGLAWSLDRIWDELSKVDLSKKVRKVRIPVYFFLGRYDYQVPFELVGPFFETLEAPHKEIIWFENSGHFPNLEEPDLFQNKLIHTVLKNTLGK